MKLGEVITGLIVGGAVIALLTYIDPLKREVKRRQKIGRIKSDGWFDQQIGEFVVEGQVPVSIEEYPKTLRKWDVHKIYAKDPTVGKAVAEKLTAQKIGVRRLLASKRGY